LTTPSPIIYGRIFDFIPLLTENTLLTPGYFSGNLGGTPLPGYKKGLRKKTGSVSHSCFKQVSLANITHPRSSTSDLPHFSLLLRHHFFSLTNAGMWSVA